MFRGFETILFCQRNENPYVLLSRRKTTFLDPIDTSDQDEQSFFYQLSEHLFIFFLALLPF